MFGEPLNDSELAAIEADLGRLVPQNPQLQRDRLLFQMGRASARGGRFWPALTACTTLLALGMAWLAWEQYTSVPSVRTVIVHVEKPAPEPGPSVPSGRERPPAPVGAESTPLLQYIRLRDDVLREGLDGIPPMPSPPPEDDPPTLDALLHSF
jgi:hypothetical protein